MGFVNNAALYVALVLYELSLSMVKQSGLSGKPISSREPGHSMLA